MLYAAPHIKARVERLELGWNRLGFDRYGVSKRHVGFMQTVFWALYRHYHRVTCDGTEHIPTSGRAMLVGNHSGGWALDGMMVIASTFLELEPPRLAQGMAEYFLNTLPFGSMMTNRTGNFTGTPDNAVRLLEDERLLMVFPEGARGTAKLYKERHSLVRFGTGFMRLALQTGTPIVPFGFVGGGEAVPTVANLEKLGKLIGVPYIPVTWYGAALPLPVPLHISYGEPMSFDGDGSEDDEVIHGYVRQVKDRIGGLIEHGIPLRGQGR
jgi:1-acyl-sn-glycerol-3-phosphate acyltransferase